MKHLIPLEVIESKILLIRGHKVLLDRDLARLYDVETRVLNQAVKRNIEHFPDDFIVVLTRDEIMRISQIVISSDLKFSKSVMAFTEEGVAIEKPARRTGEHRDNEDFCEASRIDEFSRGPGPKA